MKYLIFLVLAFVYGCNQQNKEILYPQKIGEYELTSVVQGDSAISEINTLHQLKVATKNNFIIRYGNKSEDILYISKYDNPTRANEANEKMISKMKATKNSPFSFLVPMKKYNNSYMTLGMGSVHYIYQSGNYLIWLSTKQKFYSELPSELLEIYPVNQ